ncbi:P-type conjugative transfer protein TrbJ [Xanthomonas theicola]|nr:P-type conjugative transfer protein TrbJ [Xanthomonas theicola]QNH27222.1 P-type conjugative transfer protein TrbJ [Xanthomonas theicola]
MQSKIRKIVIAATIALSVPAFVAPLPAAASGFPVFDAANFSQNIMTQINTLTSQMQQVTQLAHEVSSLANQAQQLQNDARNLTALPDSLLSSYQSAFSQLMQHVSSVQGLMQSVTAAQGQFAQKYPDFVGSLPGSAQLSQITGSWQTANAQNIQDALSQGAQILQGLPGSQADISRIAGDSQAATGALQAMQAGNQLSVAIAGQLQQMNAQNAVYQQAVLQNMASENSALQMSAAERAQNMANWGAGAAQPGAKDPSTVSFSY